MITGLTLPQYLIESSVCLVCFYGLYKLFLKRETFFQLNRIYLLSTAILSLVLPLINFQFPVINGSSSMSDFVLPIIQDVQLSHSNLIKNVENSSGLVVSVGDIIRLIYFLGVFLMGIKFLKSLFIVFNMIAHGSQVKSGKETIITGFTDLPAASFFSYIFWNDKIESDTQKSIMDHELVHVRQWHSLDVVVMELIVILKWFNPLVYLFRNNLKLTHEYIADQYVTGNSDRVAYANMLLSHSDQNLNVDLSNTFHANVKERLRMLGIQKSKNWRLMKYLFPIPVLFVLMSLFSFNISDAYLSDKIEVMNTSFENLESHELLNLKNEKEASVMSKYDINKKKDFNIGSESENVDMFFKWGSMVSAGSMENKEEQITNNVWPYELLESFQQMPVFYFKGKYWNEFEFTLRLQGKGENYMKQIMMDEDFLFDTSGVNFDDIEIVSIENLTIPSQGKSDSFYFSFTVAERKTSDKVIVPWRSRISNFLIESPAFRDVAMYETFSGENEYSPELVTKSTDEIISDLLDFDFVIKDKESEKAIDLSDYEIEISVNRAMVVDQAFELTEDAISSRIIRTYDNSNGKKYVNEKFELSDKISTYKNLITQWISDLDNKDYVYLSFKSNSEDGGNFVIPFQVRNSPDAYNPKLMLDQKFKGEKNLSNYQIIYKADGSTYIKTDVKDPANEKIVKAFSDKSKYTLVDVPGFSTEYRVLEYEEMLSGIETSIIKSAPILDDLDVLSLVELKLTKKDEPMLSWGRMVSINPSNRWGRQRKVKTSGNYSIKELHRSRKDDLQLTFDGERTLNVSRFTMYISNGESEKIQAYQSASIKSFELNKILSKVDSESIIYFDDIIVEEDGKWYHCLERFSFVFE